MSMEPGTLLNLPFSKYTLVAKLAAGGMGEIFLARFKGAGGFEKIVVVKRLLPHLAEDANFVAMFLDEARIAARLAHPNICAVHELGEVDGQYFIAMEYLDGLPLSKILHASSEDSSPLDIRVAATLIYQACEGLHYAHELANHKGQLVGLIHRDVSPSNLLVTTAGVLKVLDFGIAKAQGSLAHTNTGTIKGKYAYMSPEQLHGEILDRRSDIFSLGVVLHEAICGERLFQRETEFLIFDAITKDAIPSASSRRADVPPAVEEVITRALCRNREGRFSTARELGRALVTAIGPLGGPMTNPDVAEALALERADNMVEMRALVKQVATATMDTPATATMEVRNVDIELELTAATSSAKRLGPPSDVGQPRPNAASSTDDEPPPAQRRSFAPLAWLTAIALIAGATVIAVVLLQRDDKTHEPAPIIIQRSPAQPAPVGVGDPSVDATATTPATKPRTRGSSATRRQPSVYDRAVRRKANGFKACYGKHPTPNSPAQFTITFYDVSSAGVSARVSLSPATLASVPLGECILAVARKTRFGHQTGADSVAVTIQRRWFRRK